MADYDAELRKLLEEGAYAIVGASVLALLEARRRLRAAGIGPGAGELAGELRRSVGANLAHLDGLIGDRVREEAVRRAGSLVRGVLGTVARRLG